MPTADDQIKGITVPSLPWLQRFEPGDRVRVAAPRRRRDQRYLGMVGTVRFANEHFASVRLGNDVRIVLPNGELRPVTS